MQRVDTVKENKPNQAENAWWRGQILTAARSCFVTIMQSLTHTLLCQLELIKLEYKKDQSWHRRRELFLCYFQFSLQFFLTVPRRESLAEALSSLSFCFKSFQNKSQSYKVVCSVELMFYETKL